MSGPNEIYQYSVINTLAQGICNDGVPVTQLLTKGDHGLGTLAKMDGEVTIIDGQAYQNTSDGGARTLQPCDVTPFLMTTHFRPTTSVTLPTLSDETLLDVIAGLCPGSANSFLAIRIEGVFSQIKYRAAGPQCHPYETMAEVVERQRVGLFENQRGVVFGFFAPGFTHASSVVGLHLHFLSEDRRVGGHILQFAGVDVGLEAAVVRKYTVQLPETEECSSEVVAEPR
ncbi:alpha-acetolactate decarboxylase [Aspergillus pseudonomiae]|uniref:Alpha-acetolactate decarboxylase n=1 Tax=Aspergillus pseudonomiae TaxID=1506151 RepID=A0A5N7DGT5_9EURO|nr:alpha-acetolactate decarboxylase [Aspergillus pseudonomiae]KAB8264137.1 alpha-acetolactate decarboxylase [Aspergillus pseudonomiae]KAE8405642.1 alpha-acetolactate decarboxylase [Aspergillus pseudonomiae]